MEEQSVSIKEDLSNKQAHVSSDEGADSGGEKTDLIKSETGSIPFKLPSSPPPHSHHPNTEAEDKARGEAAAAILSLSSPKLDYKPPPWALEPSKTARYGVDVIKNGALVQSIDFASRSHATFVVIGRLAGCDIHLEHPSISRYHCVLQYGEDTMGKTGQGWHMYDLGSTHRSKLNKRQVPSKQYLRVRVGHVMQFGGSTRIMMLTGPSTDTDQEWECSPTEMRQKKERQKLDIKLHKEAEKDIIKDKHNDEEGISWGMDYSEEEAYVHAVEGELGEEREAAYRDDPLKALGHFFDREGFDLLFTFSESGSAHTHKWTCHIELPVDTAAGQSLSASATCTGSKKEAEVLCALNACKTLDMHGVLYRSRNEARRKASNLAENDFYDSDEDTYLDRTGQIEKNRESRRKRALEWKGESSEVKETYEGLVKKIAKAHEEIKGLEERLEGLSKKDSTKEGAGEDDELDAFCRNLERTPSAVENSKKKTEISQLRQRLVALKHETERNEKLAKIAKPVALPSLRTSTSSSSSKAGNGGTAGGSSVSISTMNKLLMKRRSKAAQRDKEMGMELPPVSTTPEEAAFVAEEDDDDTQTPPHDPAGSQHKPHKDIAEHKSAGNLVECNSSNDSVQHKLEAGGTEANVDELQTEHSTEFTEAANAKAREDQPKQHGAKIWSDSSIQNAKSLVEGSGLDSSKAVDGKTQKSEETKKLEDSQMELSSSLDPSDGEVMKEQEMTNTDEKAEDQESGETSAKRKRIRVRIERPSAKQSKPSGDYGEGCANRDEDYATWMPPDNQAGDGTTALNAKFAGRY